MQTIPQIGYWMVFLIACSTTATSIITIQGAYSRWVSTFLTSKSWQYSLPPLHPPLPPGWPWYLWEGEFSSIEQGPLGISTVYLLPVYCWTAVCWYKHIQIQYKLYIQPVRPAKFMQSHQSINTLAASRHSYWTRRLWKDANRIILFRWASKQV